MDGICILKADPNDSRSCAKNSDCNSWCANNKGSDDYGCYCQISANAFDAPYFVEDDGETYVYDMNSNSCIYSDFSGICQTISNTEKNNKYSSSPDFTWWSAKNFCKAIGHRMPRAAEMCGNDPDIDALTLWDMQMSNNEAFKCSNIRPGYWFQECYCDRSENLNCTCNDNSCPAFMTSDLVDFDFTTGDKTTDIDLYYAVCI